MKRFGKFIDKELLYVADENGKLSIFGLAMPMFVQQLSVHLIGMVQTMMSSRYEGGFFVIPISVANSVFNILAAILTLVNTGMCIVLSIELGRGNKENCRKLIGTSVLLGSAFAVVLSVLGLLLAEPLLLFMGMNKPEYAEYMPSALAYFRWRIIVLIVLNLGNLLIGALRCYGHTRVGLICSLAANIFACVMTAFAMFLWKMPKDFAPVGLALIVFVSQVINAFVAYLFFRKKKIEADFKFSKKLCGKVIGVGAPASVSSIFYNLSQMVTATICLNLTPAAYLANSYIGQVVYYVYLLGLCIGQANSVMVGRLCGQGNLELADKMHRQNLRIVILCNVAFSLLLALFGRGIVKLLFDAEETVVAYASYILFLDVFVEMGRGMNHIGQNGLNATGDVYFTTVVSVISCWVCSVGGAYVFGILFGLDLYGVWIAYAVDEIFRGTLYYIRWRKQDWKKRFEKGSL